MAGDVIAGNIGDGANLVPTTTLIAGVAKAWMNLNGTGTPAARDSFNTSSITDNGVGDYTQNFTTALASASFAFVGGSVGGTGACQFNSQLAGSVRYRTLNSSFAAADESYNFPVSFGNV